MFGYMYVCGTMGLWMRFELLVVLALAVRDGTVGRRCTTLDISSPGAFLQVESEAQANGTGSSLRFVPHFDERLHANDLNPKVAVTSLADVSGLFREAIQYSRVTINGLSQNVICCLVIIMGLCALMIITAVALGLVRASQGTCVRGRVSEDMGHILSRGVSEDVDLDEDRLSRCLHELEGLATDLHGEVHVLPDKRGFRQNDTGTRYYMSVVPANYGKEDSRNYANDEEAKQQRLKKWREARLAFWDSEAAFQKKAPLTSSHRLLDIVQVVIKNRRQSRIDEVGAFCYMTLTFARADDEVSELSIGTPSVVAAETLSNKLKLMLVALTRIDSVS